MRTTERWQHQCIATIALPMAHPLGLEERLRALLRKDARPRVLTRRMAALVGCLMAAVVLPISVVRLSAQAEPNIPVQRGHSAHNAQPVRKKAAFIAAVHAYNLAQIRIYVNLAQAIGQYERAVVTDKPDQIAEILAPGYTFNGQSQTPREAATALQASIVRFGKGGYTLFLTTAKISPKLPGQLSTIGIESWYSHAHGPALRTVFLRQDVWKATPSADTLIATHVTFIKSVPVSAMQNNKRHP
jgi:hypothetical protein